jgi:3-deoxy-D-manno-octulosonic-acid transferase
MSKLRLSIWISNLYYFLFFAVTGPYWVFKFLTSRKYRFGLRQRLGGVPRRAGDRPCIWIHGVSVGEVLAARELVGLWQRERPGWDVVVSVTTKTGWEVAHRTYPDVARVIFFPMDLSPFIARTFRRIRPDLIVMVELELWPNFFLTARRRGVPVVFVNGRITRRSFEGYRIIGWILAQILPHVEILSVQNTTYGERLVLLGARGDRVWVTGNMKYDNIPTDPAPDFVESLRRDLGIGPDDRLLIGGSIHPGEDEMLLGAYRRLRDRFPSLRLVLVPRHPEQFDRVERLVRGAGEKLLRRTQAADVPQKDGSVILLDTVGELGAAYALAEVIFVGGSLVPHGGQNMLEPAGLGKAVLFGRYTHNFATDVGLLLEAGAAVEVDSAEDLERRLAELLANPEGGKALGEKARALIASHKGASRRNFELIDRIFLGPERAGLTEPESR